MHELLALSAVVLGFLAFFEPCTIATHTLFAARAHQSNRSGRLFALLSLLIPRAILIVLLLIPAVAGINIPRWNPFLQGIMLLILAAVYIISRFMYLPIPHIEFYKIIPKKLTQLHGIRLGLTLPACTIPLFAVIMGLSVTVNSIQSAGIAGLLFAGMFTLPTAILIFTGVSALGQQILDRAAKITPFLTAALFIASALVFLIPQININLQSTKVYLQEPTIIGLAIGFLAGFIFSFNPVTFTSIPVMLAYVTKAQGKRRAVLMGIAFISGMIFIHVVLGVSVSAGGEWIKNIMGRFWGVILGPVLIILGLLWPGWIKIRLPWFGMKGRPVSSLWGAFLLGIPFSIAVCPFCSPALLVMLTASAAIGSILFGFFLLLSFALGRSIPFMIGVWSISWLESLNVFTKYQKRTEVIAGIIMIFSGLFFLNEYLFIIKY